VTKGIGDRAVAPGYDRKFVGGMFSPG